MNRFIIICALLIIVGEASAGEWLPMPGGPPVYSDLKWYRRNTPNFEILSLSDQQGRQVASQIEKVKSWVLTRWALPDESYAVTCRVVLVPDAATLRKLFRLNASYAELKASNGTIQETACWIVADDTIQHAIPIFITEIGLGEYEMQHRVQIPYWAKRGMGILNGDPQRVRVALAAVAQHIAQNKKIFFSESLLSISKETIMKSAEGNTALYDREVALLCLMLRKEFGQQRFLAMVSNGSPQALFTATGYSSYGQFDRAFKRYLYYAASDMATARMPDSYLAVEPVGGVK